MKKMSNKEKIEKSVWKYLLVTAITSVAITFGVVFS
jgi:hypothetical protein